jgi:hypothetical protein
MGAWGHGSFENDSALDWLGELLDGKASLVKKALQTVAKYPADEYLDADDASAALAAAELVAAALGKGDERLNKNATEWLAAHRDEAAKVGADLAHRAVDRVYRESELRELWDENGPQTPWHADVEELLRRLKA